MATVAHRTVAVSTLTSEVAVEGSLTEVVVVEGTVDEGVVHRRLPSLRKHELGRCRS